MPKTTKIRVIKLDKPVHGWADHHDRPLKWACVGPGEEIQKFTCKKDAVTYRKIRSRAIDQRAAIINFS